MFEVNECLYFYRPTTITTYSNIPSENIDISRLLDGQKPFVSAETSLQKAKKALIIERSAVNFLSNAQRQRCETRLQQLQSQEFAVYVQHEGNIQSYDVAIQAKIAESALKSAAVILTPEQCSQHLNLAIDELLLIGPPLLDLLASGCDASLSRGNAPILSFVPKEDIQSLHVDSVETLEQSGPLLRETLPGIQRLAVVDKINQKAFLHLACLLSPFVQLKTVELSLALSYEKIDSLGWAQVCAVTSQIAWTLTALKLNNCNAAEAILTLPFNFSILEVLHVSDAQMTTATLEKCLAIASPSLKHLELNNCENIHDLSPAVLQFSQLETFVLAKTNIGQEAFVTLLRQAQSTLTVLNINNNCASFRANKIPLAQLQLPRLERFSARHSWLCSTELSQLLAHTTQLREISLAYCNNIAAIEIPEAHFNWSQLTQLNIFYTSMPLALLASIVSKAPALEQLCAFNLGWNSAWSVRCLALKELNLFEAVITPAAFSPQAHDPVQETCLFPLLETLKLQQSSIDATTLFQFLMHSPKLNSLNVIRCPALTLETIDAVRQQRPGLVIESGLNSTSKPNETYPLKENTVNRSSLKKKQSNNVNLWLGKENNHPEVDLNQTATAASSTITPSPMHPAMDTLQQQELAVDANTTSLQQTFAVDRTFTGKPSAPQARDLRYATFNRLRLNQSGGINKPFILYNDASTWKFSADMAQSCRAQAPLYEAYSQAGADHYFCRVALQLTCDWQALPSAFAHEKLQHFYLDVLLDVELVHSDDSGLHYMRFKNPHAAAQAVTLEVRLFRPHTPSFADLPAEIREIAKFCRGFRADGLRAIAPNADASTYLQALIQQRVGSCRQRAIVFMYRIREEYPDIPVRLVTNAVHIFAEIYHQQHWVPCDLGGYTAQLRVNEQTLAEHEPGKERIDNPIEVYQKTLSDSGKPLAPDFFKKARNLTTLTLHECSRFPQQDLTAVETLIITSSPITADALHALLASAPHLKTLIIKNCTITAADFARLDFSALSRIEQVTYRGDDDFISDLKGLLRLVKTAAQAQWMVESAFLPPLLDTMIPSTLKIDFRHKARPLPQRYFAHRQNKTRDKKQAPDILQRYGKTLVDTLDARRARVVLQKTAASLSQTHYFIDSAQALRCNGPYIQRQGEQGRIINQPGGPLYEFLMQAPGKKKNLIIDYTTFKIQDFATCNSILDEPRVLDGIILAEEVHLIGLINRNHPEAYQGNDFYSRFDAIEEMIPQSIMPLPTPTPLPKKYTDSETVIELCGGEQWQARLIGHWIMQNQQLTFKPGSLLQALQVKKTMVYFNHAPLHDAKFLRFLDDLNLYHAIYDNGHLCATLPENFQWQLTQEVHLPYKNEVLQVCVDGVLTAQHHILNSTNQSDFLGSYVLDPNTQQLHLQAGRIAQQRELLVYLTHSLSLYTWLLLLEHCHAHHTRLQLTLAPGVTLPIALASKDLALKRASISTNAATSVNPITMPESVDIMIDVSELTADDLCATFSCSGWNAVTERFEFTSRTIYPWQALAAGKTVLLQGEWTPDVADAVQIILFHRLQQNETRGKLIVRCQQPGFFSAFASAPLPALSQVSPEPEIIATYDQRLSAVEAVLARHPLVCITGATGVGKTHFVTQIWQAKYSSCYYGEEHMLNFLNDSSTEGWITLYLNEANLTHQQWSMFEGLFHQPPAVFYKNHYYPLTTRHKVIFDGNPLTYGGERQTPRLLQRHPYQVQFQPLPREVLAVMLAAAEDVAAPLLDVILYLTQLQPNDTLLTPREMKMMLYLVTALVARYPTVAAAHWARYVAYTLSQTHVPREHQATFEQRFHTPLPVTLHDVILSSRNTPPVAGAIPYVLNHTHLPAVIAVQGHLAVRAARLLAMGEPRALNIGLGGLILEGESGEGKSQLILQQLLSSGYKQPHDFIYITAKAQPNEIQQQLLHAFSQGLMVVMDEINTLPLPERLLNALLEGHELQNNPPQKPGFLLFGTQNPLTYHGRLKTTLPLVHRLQKVVMANSTPVEKQAILQHIGLPPRVAQDLCAEYARRSDLTFRDVMRAAKHWQAQHQIESSFYLYVAAIKQVGSLCKIVAIANVEQYYAKQYDYPPIPLWSEKKACISIRKIAKTRGSMQGEILEMTQWRNIICDLGFKSTLVNFQNNMPLFITTITNSLKAGYLPLLAFPVERDSGLPDQTPNAAEETEHAAVISGYDSITDTFTLIHWGKSYHVDSVMLFNATHALTATRQQEFYTKNPAYWHTEKWIEKKYVQTFDSHDPHIDKRSMIPPQNSGFKTQLLIVHAPEKQALLRTRALLQEKSVHQHQQTSLPVNRHQQGIFFKSKPSEAISLHTDFSSATTCIFWAQKKSIPKTHDLCKQPCACYGKKVLIFN